MDNRATGPVSPVATAVFAILVAGIVAAAVAWLVTEEGDGDGATISAVLSSPGDWIGDQVRLDGRIERLSPSGIVGTGTVGSAGRGAIGPDRGAVIGEEEADDQDATVDPGAPPAAKPQPQAVLAFTLGDENDQQVLVISGDGQPFVGLRSNSRVAVTGTVRRFDRDRVQALLGEAYGDGFFDDFEGRPVLVASDVDRTAALTR